MKPDFSAGMGCLVGWSADHRVADLGMRQEEDAQGGGRVADEDMTPFGVCCSPAKYHERACVAHHLLSIIWVYSIYQDQRGLAGI